MAGREVVLPSYVGRNALQGFDGRAGNGGGRPRGSVGEDPCCGKVPVEFLHFRFSRLLYDHPNNLTS